MYANTDDSKTNPSVDNIAINNTQGIHDNINGADFADDDSKTNNSINSKLGFKPHHNTIEEDGKVKNCNDTIDAIKETGKSVHLNASFKSGNNKTNIYSNALVSNASYNVRDRDGRDGFKIDGSKIDNNASVSNIGIDIKALASYIHNDGRDGSIQD